MVAVTAASTPKGKGKDKGAPDAPEGPTRWPQFLAAGFATLCAASSGSVLGWSSPSLPELQRQQLQLVRDNASVNVTLLPAIVTEEQASWAGAAVPLGALLGSLPAGFLADALGRKPLMLGVGAHFLLGWLLIVAATMRRGVWLLFGGRALQGACCGAITVVAPLYLEEIAEAQVRGCTGVLFDLATNAGVLTAYVLGALLPPPALAAALAALPALFLAAFAWMPESPVHLAAHGHDARARRALSWLRAGRDVTEELAEMRDLLRQSGRLRAQSPSALPSPAALEAQEGAAAAAKDDAKTKTKGKRVSLPALLGGGGGRDKGDAPGRRYSTNLCAAAAATQHDGVFRKDKEVQGLENAAFEDTEGLPRVKVATVATVEAAIFDAEEHAKKLQMHRPLEARSSALPILGVDVEAAGAEGGRGRWAGVRAWADDLRWGSPASRALCVVFALMLIRPATGINAITFYTVSIFSQAGTSLSPSMATVLIGALLVPCNLLASRLVERVGRRALLLGSSAGIAACYALLVAYSWAPAAPRWLPVLAIAVFTVSFCLGLGPLPWLLMSELLPLRHRRWAAGAAGAVAWAGAFAVTKFFGAALHALGPRTLYAAFCASAVAGGLFIALFVPETRGKTRQQLQGEPESPCDR